VLFCVCGLVWPVLGPAVMQTAGNSGQHARCLVPGAKHVLCYNCVCSTTVLTASTAIIATHTKGATPHASRCFFALCLGLGFLGRLPALLLKPTPMAAGPLPVDPNPAAADALPPPAVAADRIPSAYPHSSSEHFCQYTLQAWQNMCQQLQANAAQHLLHVPRPDAPPLRPAHSRKGG
jgi:hypothetical protein